jgi:hypothetical protein
MINVTFSHAIGNDGADSRQVRLGRQEVDDVVKPILVSVFAMQGMPTTMPRPLGT